MKQKHKKKPRMWQKLALERIYELFKQADRIFHYKKEYSNRYVEIARKIAMKYKVKVPRNIKRRYCKHCNFFLVPGATSRVRIHKNRVIYFCKSCKKFMRFPL